jgi:hypothetical protein
VAAATWLVPSQSDPGGVHAVALVDGYLHCDCFASLAGHPCAHAAAVCLVLLAGPVREQGDAAPDASPRSALQGSELPLDARRSA